MVDFARYPTCGSALARVLTAVVAGDVPQKTSDILSSATLIVLLKKDAAAMEAMKLTQAATYLQPQRPMGMGTVIVKAACNCALLMVKEAMGPVVGPSQFVVETKGGCAQL